MSGTSARLSLVFSCLGHAYIHLFTAFYFVIVLALEKSWNLPYHELVELWTAGAFLVGLGALPAGWLGDRWSASGMMVVFFLGMGAASILCGLVEAPLALFLGLSAIGLFASIYHPVGIAWLVRNAEARGKALGINGLFGAIGVAVAGLVAGNLIAWYSWRAAFIVPGVVSLLTGFALLLCLRLGLVVEAKRDVATREQPRGRDEMLRAFLLLLVTMAAMGLVFQATQAALPKLFDLRLNALVGGDARAIGNLVALVYGLGGLMQVAGGHFADRFPLKPVYFGGLLLQVPVLFGLAMLAGPSLVVVAVLCVVLSTAVLPAENMLLAQFTPEHRRSLVFGIKYVLAFGVAPLSIQFVARVQAATGDFTWVFLILAGSVTVALIAALLLPGQRRAGEARLPAE